MESWVSALVPDLATGSPGVASSPIVFLDIDGVLNSTRSLLASVTHRGFDPVACRLVTWLLEGAVARFVISSAWRIGRSRAEMIEALAGAELPTECLHADWSTPESGPRGEEIQRWLHDHPEIVRDVVLDDGIGLEAVEAALVKTEVDLSLTFHDLLRACHLLGWNATEALRAREIRLTLAERTLLQRGKGG